MSGPQPVLRQQQRAFAAAVLGRDSNGLLQASPQGHTAPVEVYRRAYPARLTGALRDNYEILALALGDDGFDALAAAYLQAQPSRQPSIRWFGHALVAFMDQRLAADDGLVPHPALVDLARMDWALRGAFDAADAPVIEHAALAGTAPDDWPTLVLQLHPSVQLVPLQWAVEAAWHALRSARDLADRQLAGATGTADAAEPELPAPEALHHSLLVWRIGPDTQWRSLAETEARLLQAVAEGASFAALCELAASLVEQPEPAVPLVVAALQQWLTDGLISAVGVDDPPANANPDAHAPRCSGRRRSPGTRR